MTLALRNVERFGVNQVLGALNISKGTWYYRQNEQVPYEEKYQKLKKPLMKIARKHSEYGYRKVVSALEEMGIALNHKVVQKLQKHWELPLIRRIRKPSVSAIRKVIDQLGDKVNLVARLKKIEAFDVLYTDFTEILYDKGKKKAYLMPLIDHNSKLAVGWAVGPADNSTLALQAWDRAKKRMKVLYRKNISRVIVHHDKDGVYTGHRWLHQVRVVDGARVSYSLNGARGNTAMESFNGHFKGENDSAFWDQRTLLDLIKTVESRMQYYNEIRAHQSLGNKSPDKYLMKLGVGHR